MADAAAANDVICLHCSKPFSAEVLSPQTGHAGVKCPHCKLFMPLERVGESDQTAA